MGNQYESWTGGEGSNAAMKWTDLNNDSGGRDGKDEAI